MDQKTLADYEIIKRLGFGAFGTVYKAKRSPDNKIIALKVIDIPAYKPDLVEKTKMEIDTLKKLANPECNPFVICYYDSYYDDKKGQFLIEMELIEGKDMEKYVDYLWDNKSKEMVYYYLLLITNDLLKGLKYTHDKNILHNDIKLDNIMIDTKNIPRIIDYGLSCTAIQIEKYKYCQSYGGTPKYIAPELYSLDLRIPASDLWALGISLYISATHGEYPFDVDEFVYTFESPFFSDRDIEPKKLQTNNNQLNKLVNGLLTKDYTKRLTADQGLAMLKNILKPKEVVELVPLSTSPSRLKMASKTSILNPLEQSALNSLVFL